MSSGMYGADVAQLRELARQFERASQELGHARGRVGSGIQITAWAGPVAVRFRGSWDSEHSRAIDAAATALHDAADVLARNASDQETTSRATDGSFGSSIDGHRSSATPVVGARGDFAIDFGPITERAGAGWQAAQDMFQRGAATIPDQYEQLRQSLGRIRTALEAQVSGDWAVGDFTQFVPGIGSAGDVLIGLDKAVNGQMPWKETLDLAAGGMRASKNPLWWAGGFTVANVADAIEGATTVRWDKESMDAMWLNAWQNPGSAWGEVGRDMVTKLPRLLAGNATFW